METDTSPDVAILTRSRRATHHFAKAGIHDGGNDDGDKIFVDGEDVDEDAGEDVESRKTRKTRKMMKMMNALTVTARNKPSLKTRHSQLPAS